MSTRKRNSIRNTLWGLINKFTSLIGQFLIRTIIIEYIGVVFLGLNSLMVSILQVLSLAELGFSNAIIYSLYKPLANKEIEKVRSLLSFYRKVYRFVGIVIILIGIVIIPFIPKIIKQELPSGFNIYIFYMFYLLNTSLSYFLFAYKTALITADQRNDIISKISLLSQVVLYLLQVFVLILTHNIYYFVLAAIVSTLMNNILIEYVSRKLYPEYFCSGYINRIEKNSIIKLVGGIMVQKLCQTFRTSLNSICLSAFTSLTIVAIYGNYYYFLTILISMCSVFTSAVSASIGNCIATKNKKENYDDMNHFIFGYSWLSGWTSICLLCLSNPLMDLWVGRNLTFPFHIVLMMTIYYYILSMGDIRALYHSAAGLWWQGKKIWLFEALLNLLLCVILGKYWGVEGIVLSMIITVLFVNFGMGSNILFKFFFTEFKIKQYFYIHLKYILISLVIGAITFVICDQVQTTGIFNCILKGIICLLIPNTLYILIYSRTEQFRYFKKQFMNIRLK